MKPRNLLIAAVVLAALSGGVWYSKVHPPSGTPAGPSTTTPKLVDVPSKEIRSIDLKKKDGSAVTLDRQSDKWNITAPAAYKADTEAANSLASSLSPVSADNVVEDKASDIAKYGLSAPSLTVSIHRTNGKSDQIFFGDDIPAGSLVYARVNSDPKVYAVASSVKSALDKSVNDLRDKRLLTFDTSKLTRLELISAKTGIEFGKNNQNEWQILKPEPYRADSFQVEELVRKLSDAKMDLSSSADDAKKSAVAFAAAKPFSTVKVSDSSGTQTLDVRKNKDDYYAKTSVIGGIYKLASDTGKALEKNVDDFRNKKLFDFAFSDPTRIDIQNTGRTRLLIRSGTDWKVDGKTMDAGTVQSFLDKLRDLSAAKFVATGFAAPVAFVSVTSNEGKRTEKVEFSKTADGYIARRENEPAQYQLDAKAVNDMLEASNAIKAAAPANKK